MLFRELIGRNELQLLAISRPLVEEISVPALRRHQHVRQTLPVCIAVESRVLRDGAKDSARIKLILIRQCHRHTVLIQVIRSRLRYQSIDVRMLRAQRKRIHGQRQHLVRRKQSPAAW